MRWQFKVLAVVAFAFATLEVANSQFQPGGGFGGFGKGGGQGGPFTLINIKGVAEEIKLTDDQKNKMVDAQWKAIAMVLDDGQVKRLKQLDLQQRDYRAFTDPKVQETLKMTDQQKDSIKTIIADYDKEVTEMFKDFKGGGGKGGGFEKMQTLAKETKERVQGVLTKEQKRQFTEMLGDTFEFPTFGGKGKGKGGN
jgi:hypothetical protein